MLLIGMFLYLFYSYGALSDPVVGGGEVVVHEVGRVLVSAGSTRVLQGTSTSTIFLYGYKACVRYIPFDKKGSKSV